MPWTSTVYGYSLTVPAGWASHPAVTAWDGTGLPGHDEPEADLFDNAGPTSLWVLSTPTTRTLADQVKQVIAGTVTDHSDTCPPAPATQEPVTVGGEPGVLLSYDCGLLINLWVAVHDGMAWVFGFRDAAIDAATDPADRTRFLEVLESVTFPG